MAFKVIKEDILSHNEMIADEVRETLANAGTFMINIISSPGSGKTLFLEKAGPLLKEAGIDFAILTGDCFTSRDAERLDRAGLPVVQINTGGACHINAELIQKALKEVDVQELDLVIVENVGNLVCPADFDIGEDFKIAFHSTTEGDDKPIKYPMLVKESSLAIINKIDLIEVVDFDIDFTEKSIQKINPAIKVLRTSSKTGEGIDGFVKWIKEKIKENEE